jgi:hypothetical protein
VTIGLRRASAGKKAPPPEEGRVFANGHEPAFTCTRGADRDERIPIRELDRRLRKELRRHLAR